MCCGPSLNLCRCGCPESEHEDVLDIISFALIDPSIAALIPLPFKKGKCHGVKVKPLEVEEIRAARERGEKIELTEPCDCPEYHSLFEEMCRLP